MAWQQILVTLVRNLTGDMTSPFRHSDETIEEIVITAALHVVMEVDFANTYTVNLSQYSITPDPVESTAEVAFQILVALKAVEIIAAGEYRTASDKAISFKDGPSQLDTRGVADAKREILRDAELSYSRARTSYLTGDGLHGVAVVTPYNIGYYAGKTLATAQREMYGNWS